MENRNSAIKLIKSHDKQIRAAEVRYVNNGKPVVIKRPINKLYLLEASFKTLDEKVIQVKFCDEDNI